MAEPRWFPSVFDAVMAPLEARCLRRLRREILADLQGRLLDIGVGTGANLGLYSPHAQVVAIDLDEGMLARARGRPEAAGIELRQMDASQLDFQDASFDAVVSTLVFCGIDDPMAALAEIRRVLEPGGKLVMMEHTLGPHRTLNAVLRGISALTGPLLGESFDRPIACYVVEAGFTGVSCRMLALGTFQLIEATRSD